MSKKSKSTTIRWDYEYSSYPSSTGKKITNFVIFDNEYRTILNTNEDLPVVQQENIARLAALAPALAAAGEKVIRCWEHGDLAEAVCELAALLDHPMEATDATE